MADASQPRARQEHVMTETPAPFTMSQADYARHREVSPPRISALIAEGRIPVDENRRVLFDAAEATLGPMPGKAPPSAPAGGAGVSPDQTTLAQAQTRKALADAAMSEAKLKKMAGELVDRADSMRRVYDLFADLKSKILTLPVRIAGQLRSLETEREISAALASAIEDEFAAYAAQLHDLIGSGGSADMSDAPEELPSERLPCGDAGGGASLDASPAAEPERVG